MANDNKGAYWLDVREKVFNPYYGEKMLKCGENRGPLGDSPQDKEKGQTSIKDKLSKSPGYNH